MLGVAGVLFLVWHEVSRGDRYRLGMTLAEVKSISGGRFPTERFAVEYDEQPTPVQMEKDALYYSYEEEAGVLLVFTTTR